MDARSDPATSVARVAAAIGEPARARMIFCLMDGLARTSTELALAAEVGPSTASAHLSRLRTDGLVRVATQGKHRYYRLDGAAVAVAVESLTVLAGASRAAFVPSTPSHLRAARTCYDHIAGALGVELHDTLVTRGWLAPAPGSADDAYDLTAPGAAALERRGLDVAALHARRRRLAFACTDWSERRPHLGGALGAALLELALRNRWVTRQRDSRALSVTARGQRELHALSRTRD